VEKVLYTCTYIFYFSFYRSIWISRTLHFVNHFKNLIVLLGKISFYVAVDTAILSELFFTSLIKRNQVENFLS
jgi:hypothetical protein